MAKEFEPLEVVTPDGDKLLWPLYGPSGQPIIIAPHGNAGEYAQAIAEREAPNLRPRTVLAAIEGAVNKYGLPEGEQLGAAVSRGPRHRPDTNRSRASSYSREVQCPTLNSPKISGPQVPAEDDCHLWTINIQPLNMDVNTVLVLYVDYALGGLNYRKIFPLNPFQTLVSIPIQGRQVTTALAASQAGEADYVVLVDVAIEHGIHADSTERFCPIWRKDAKIGGNYTAYQNVLLPTDNVSKAGLFFAATGTILNMGGAAVLFPLLFDVAVGGLPADNTVPLYTGPALTAANQNFSFGDEFRPTINFVQGLVLALSTNPDVMAHQNGATKWSSVKIGF